MHGYGVKRKNAELHSLRCDMRLKLDVAEMFRNDVMCVRTPGHGTCLPVQQHHMHTQTHVRPPPPLPLCAAISLTTWTFVVERTPFRPTSTTWARISVGTWSNSHAHCALRV